MNTQSQIQALEKSGEKPRWKGITRPYSEEVLKLRGKYKLELYHRLLKMSGVALEKAK